jgi:serine/threonine-protein kinase
VPKLDGVDGRIRPLLEKMLQPRPEDRPASMADVAEWQGGRLLGRRAGGGSGARSADRSYERGRPSSQPLLLAFGSLAAVAAAGAIVFYLLNPWRPEGFSENIPEVAAAPAPESVSPALTSVGGGEGSETAELTAATEDGAAPEAPSAVNGPALTGEAPVQPAAGGVEPVVPAEPASPAAPAGEVDVAMLPPAGVAGRVEQYVRDYTGGECLFLEPVAVGEDFASIEAFSAAIEPVQRLDQKFKADNGFEANIELRQVEQAQCPATIFLRHVEKQPGGAPILSLRDDILKSGDKLVGEVSGLAGRSLTLLLVSDDGRVYNITDATVAGADPAAFDLRVDSGGGDTEATPQLLLALASPTPIHGLPDASAPQPAAEIFPELTKALDAKGDAIGVTAGYFRLEP